MRFRKSNLPCTALPGTPHKVEVMRYRAKLKLPLFHPLDILEVEDDPLNESMEWLPVWSCPRKNYRRFKIAQQKRRNENAQLGTR